jgi:DNA-binding beta-propeller fold protein YncE
VSRTCGLDRGRLAYADLAFVEERNPRRPAGRQPCMSVIDQRTFRVTATIATGNSPYGIAVVQPRPTNG